MKRLRPASTGGRTGPGKCPRFPFKLSFPRRKLASSNPNSPEFLSLFSRAPLAVALLILTLLGLPAAAQTGTIRGFVTDAADGQPLPGVNVILTNAAGEIFGNASDTDGFFAISRVPVGDYSLRATYIGFQDFELEVTVEGGSIQTVQIELRVEETELGEVVVEGARETAGAANVTAGLQTVRPADISLVPAPDISADLVNYLTALPGVVSQGDRGGQLFIRGGEPTQNLVLLDGMQIFQPFHVVGFFSAFPSDIINTADVYAGGYGGKFGGRLSSVIDITARTGNKQRAVGAVTVAPFVSSVRLEGPIVPGKVSFLGSFRKSVIEQGAAKLIDEPLPFSFDDAFAKIHANLGASAQLSISGIRTSDNGRLGVNPLNEDSDGITQDEVNWQNQAIGTRFIFLPATLPVFAEIMINYSELTNEFGPPGAPVRTTAASIFSFQSNVTHYVGNNNFNWGIFLSSSQMDANLGGLFQNVQLQKEFITEVGAYLEPEFKPVAGLNIQPGVRLQSFPSKGDSFIEPRIRIVWNTGIHRLSVAGGIYHQEITGLNDRRDAGDIFTAWTASPFGTIPEARHAIAGYRIEPASWVRMSAEGFYKDLRNLNVPEWTAYPRFTTNVQIADGSAKGFDLRMELGKSEAFQTTISWGRSNVQYETTARALQLLTGDDQVSYAPPHDRKDQLNVMTNVQLAGFNFSVRWQFGSGLPFNESLGFDRFVLMDTLVTVAEVPGDERVLYGRPYTGRLPTYHRLDVSLDREFRIGPTTFLTVQTGLLNAYDRRNLFYLDLFTLRRVDQLPLIPTVGLKLEYK